MVLLRFDKEKKEWLEINKEDRIESDIYLDGNLRKILDHYKKQKEKDNDILLIISGDEGSGKSSLAGNVMEYMSDGVFDPTKHLIGSDYLDGLTKIEEAPDKACLMFDEGNSFFLATDTMKREHRDFHKIFSIFRQKNLFVVVCLPSFFRMGSYFAMDRSAGLLRTYLKDGKRSYFTFHGRKLKDKLYRFGKKDYNYNAVRARVKGRFDRCYKLETAEYKKFKGVTLSDEIKKAKAKQVPVKTAWQHKLDLQKDMVRKNMKLSGREIAKVLGLTEQRVCQLKKEIKEEEKESKKEDLS